LEMRANSDCPRQSLSQNRQEVGHPVEAAYIFPTVVEHPLAQDVVCTSLVAFARLLQLGDDIGFEARRNSLLYRAIEPGTHSISPRAH
jgi:hypothetical protein